MRNILIDKFDLKYITKYSEVYKCIMKMERIIVEASDFERNFKANPTFIEITDLQIELDHLVDLHNEMLDKYQLHPKTQIIADHILVLKNKLFE